MMRAVVVVFLMMAPVFTQAHEIRPAYLQLHEESSGVYSVLWKTPMRGEMRLSLNPEFSGQTENLTPVTNHVVNNASIQTWRLKALDPLRGQTVRITGLAATMTDALVQIQFSDGTDWTQRLTPGNPSLRIPERQSGLAVAGVYLKLGIEHILTGFDHLLFVLALLLITKGGWRLIKTVTAFTIAHSITLSAATLGFIHVPPPPVEAVIALSIVFVAAEIIHTHRGQPGITAQAPWIVAFTFGLLHGFGFAGALSEVGLPQGQIPLALLFFNLGVEAGQLIFIMTVFSIIAIFRQLRVPLSSRVELASAYVIGTMAMFWVIQRVTGFWG